VDGYGVVLNPVDKNWYILDFDTSHPYEGVTCPQSMYHL
jgi:hypothetical protein